MTTVLQQGSGGRNLLAQLNAPEDAADAPPTSRINWQPGCRRARPTAGMHPDYPIKNLVMEGGGARGLAYCGAIIALDELGVLKHVSRFAGASAGSMVAMYLALGYTPAEIDEMAGEADMEAELKDGNLCCGVLRMLGLCCADSTLGVFAGDRLHKFIGGTIEARTGDPDTTFKELYDDAGVELCCVVCNITARAPRGGQAPLAFSYVNWFSMALLYGRAGRLTAKIGGFRPGQCMTTEEWHVKTTPNKPIRDAVRASIRAANPRGPGGGVPQDPFAPRRGPLGPSPYRKIAIGNAHTLVPGPYWLDCETHSCSRIITPGIDGSARGSTAPARAGTAGQRASLHRRRHAVQLPTPRL
jgi:hypothetical protein